MSLYATCDAKDVPSVMHVFQRAAAEVGMQANTAKTQVWGVPRETLPPEARQWHTDAVKILGNTVDRSAGDLVPPQLGDGAAAFTLAMERVIKGMEQIWALHQHGLSRQSAQGLARVLASTKPQHVLRSTRVSDAQAEAYDRVAEKIWEKILEPIGGFTREQRLQLHLPIQEGGFSVGGASARADAAYVLGNMAAWPEVLEAAEATGAESLRQLAPSIVEALEEASTRLATNVGAPEALRWRTDRPMTTKGKQREWTRAITAKKKQELLEVAPRRQAIAIQSGSGPDAGLYLSLPSEESHRMADAQFTKATKRRMGMPVHDGMEAQRACGHVKANGSRCGKQLDAEGHHAATCECGGAFERQHDAIRDLLCRRVAADLAAATTIEQRIAGEHEDAAEGARLDVAVSLPGNATEYLDVSVVDAFSENAATEFGRARKPGLAARAMENKKRTKYPPALRLVPFVIEAHGRLGEAAARWLQKAYKGDAALRRSLCAELAALLQSHAASRIMAAIT